MSGESIEYRHTQLPAMDNLKKYTMRDDFSDYIKDGKFTDVKYRIYKSDNSYYEG